MFKILIIDDSRILRERLSTMLNEIDDVVIVGEAAYAAEGLDLVSSCNPDFVILDISLPDVGGIEVLKEIKKNYTDLRVAILTNYPYPSYRTRCKELGADYFFDKSLEFLKAKEVLMELASETCQ
ncbi:MAG: response regulator transcription factor [Proteobacteria bacterium]|nr:response regulator transcription factor [Pseudomonadota bacterium]